MLVTLCCSRTHLSAEPSTGTFCHIVPVAPAASSQDTHRCRRWYSLLLCGTHSRHLRHALLQGTGLRGCEVTCPDGCIPPPHLFCKCSPLKWGTHTHGLAKPLQFLPVHLASILIPAAMPHFRLLCQQPCCSSPVAAVWLAGTLRLLPSACHVLLLFFVRCFCFLTLLLFVEVNPHSGCLLGCLRGTVWVCAGSAPLAAAGATQCVTRGAAHRHMRLHTLVQSALAAGYLTDPAVCFKMEL